MTRLLKTAIIGRCAKAVDSSRMDIEAGLSGLNIRRTPPGFWAWTALAVPNTASKASDAISRRSLGVMTRLLRYRSPRRSRRARAFLFHAGAVSTPLSDPNYGMAARQRVVP